MAITIHTKLPENQAVSRVLRIMGVDPSTHTGIAILQGEYRKYANVIEFPKAEGFRKLQLIANAVVTVAEEHHVDRIFIEQIKFSGGFVDAAQQNIAFLIRFRLWEAGFKWYNVAIPSLKKWVTGNGHADKKEMRVSVQKRWGFLHKDDNEVDAYALARLGQHVLGMPSGTKFKGVAEGNG